MIPQLIKLRGDVSELQEKVAEIQERELRDLLTTDDKFDTLKAVHNELVDRVSLLAAHVEQLHDRLYALEGGPPPPPFAGGPAPEPE
jgi:hypothetical protein